MSKFLDYDGLTHYDGLIKDYIEEHGGEEIYIGNDTPSTEEYKVWINPDGETSPVYTKTETDTLLADKQHTLTAGTNITIANNVISASGEPSAYIKSASVNNKTLTLTNKDDTTTTFTDTGSTVSVSSTGTATDTVQYITVDGVEKKLAGGGGSYTAGRGITISNNVIAIKQPLNDVSQIETGADNDSYFQSRRFRGEGTARTYYHAIDFGYSGHNQVDFHEYGGAYNFYKNTSGTSTGGTLLFQISDSDLKDKNTSIITSGTNDGTNWTSLTIGGVTKSIPSGGSGGSILLYSHAVKVDFGIECRIYINITNTSSTPFNRNTLKSYLTRSYDQYVSVSGYRNNDGTYTPVIGMYVYDASPNSWNILLANASGVGLLSNPSVSDSVLLIS